MYKREDYWISTSEITCKITVQDYIVIDSAPILKQFIGQSIHDLLNWLTNKFGEVRWKKL